MNKLSSLSKLFLNSFNFFIFFGDIYSVGFGYNYYIYLNMYIENNTIKNYISFWLVSMFFIISVMIVVGGLTRLTDSGLSITEWQLFSGLLPPLSNSDWNNYFDLYKKIPEFKEQNYYMSLDEFKVIFWWEWAHRFLGRIIGISFLLPLIFFYYKTWAEKIKQLIFYLFFNMFSGIYWLVYGVKRLSGQS